MRQYIYIHCLSKMMGKVTHLECQTIMCNITEKKKDREKKKHDFLNDLISGGPYKCQDHPAGERKGPCYPESCSFYFSDYRAATTL